MDSRRSCSRLRRDRSKNSGECRRKDGRRSLVTITFHLERRIASLWCGEVAVVPEHTLATIESGYVFVIKPVVIIVFVIIEGVVEGIAIEEPHIPITAKSPGIAL